MGFEKRIASLKTKHAALDAALELEMLMPSRDGLKIASLKKKKLHLKDEIFRLENPARLTAPKRGKTKQSKKSKAAVAVSAEASTSPNTSVTPPLTPGAEVDLAA